jgi:hypothetical protein
MATQTRLTIRRSARFLRTTLKASVVVACCGLVLWSAIAAHAGVDGNGFYVNGLPVNGYPLQGMPIQGLPINGLPMNGTPLHGPPANEGSLPTVQSEGLPWSTVSQRPLGQSTP